MSISSYSPQEIVETIRMVQMEKLDIRTITMGISLRDCVSETGDRLAQRIYDKVCRRAAPLVAAGQAIAREYGMPVTNTRVSVTPVAVIAEGVSDMALRDSMLAVAHALDRAAREIGVNFIGGFSALVHKGFTPGDLALIEAIPEALAQTERVGAAVNIGSTKAGINMEDRRAHV